MVLYFIKIITLKQQALYSLKILQTKLHKMKKLLFSLCFILLNTILFAQNISGVVNNYAAVVNIPACDPCSNYCNQFDVSSTAGFNVGDKVLIMQMKGATVDLTNTAAFGTINSYGNAGGYEFKTISSISGSTILFTTSISSIYNIANSIQLVRVPQYTNPTVTGTLTAQPWNGSTGGVLIFDVSGTLTLQADIDVTATGFRGGSASGNAPDYIYGQENYFYNASEIKLGAPKGESIAQMVPGYESGKGAFANGAGGGNAHNAGGGGGSNGGIGGNGGKEHPSNGNSANSDPNTGGIGGYTLQYTSGNRLFMGGGGGGGHQNDNAGTPGANGGGIVFITANQLVGNNHNIISNGGSVATFNGGGNDGAGGGGSGGTIKINTSQFSGNTSLICNGGNGGSIPPSGQQFGPGGGGSGGVICLENSSIPGNVSTHVNGGINGVNIPSNDAFLATGGAGGQVFTSCTYTAPATSVIMHVPHPKATPKKASCSGSTSNDAGVIFTNAANTITYAYNAGNTYTGSATFTSGSTAITTNIAGLSNPATTDSYTIRIFLSAICSFDTTVQISNTPTVTTPIVTAYAVCGTTGNHTLTASGTNLVWYTVATLGKGSTTAPNLDLSVPTSTTYYVSQKVNGCESSRAPLSVDIKATPAAPSVSDYTTCSTTGNHPLTSTGTNVFWYTVATMGTGNASAPNLDLSVPTTRTYYASQTVNGCESARAALAVNIKATPAAPTVSDYTICSTTGNHTLTATGTNVLWYTDATTSTSNTAAPILDISVPTTTTYYASQTANSCESTRAALGVNIKATPIAPAVSDYTICSSTGNHTLTATGTNVLWYTNATTATSNTVAPILDLSVPTTTTYYVSQAVSTCESTRASLAVNIKATPAAPAVSDYTTCSTTGNHTLNAMGTNLLWYTDATIGTGSAVAPNLDLSTPVTETYFVSQSINACESARAPLAIKITNTPTAPITSPYSICSSMNTHTLTAIGTGLTWYTDATITTGTNTAPVIDESIYTSISYFVSQTVDGCESTRSELPIHITEKPNPSIPISNTTICTPQSVLIKPEHLLNSVTTTYKWYKDGQFITNVNTNTYQVQSTDIPGGAYVFEETNGTCSTKSNAVHITIIQTPHAYAGSDITVKKGTVVILNAQGGDLYSWSPSTDLDNGFVPNPQLTAKETTTYTVNVSDITNTCFDTDEVTVTVKSPIAIPNVITINGDGVNDTWIIDNINEYPNATIEIFNRWGNIVWKSIGYSKQWDGTSYHNGEVLPDGTYFYIINLQNQLYKEPSTGWIQIIK
jgi:gliding motility-associated-like protein